MESTKREVVTVSRIKLPRAVFKAMAEEGRREKRSLARQFAYAIEQYWLEQGFGSLEERRELGYAEAEADERSR